MSTITSSSSSAMVAFTSVQSAQNDAVSSEVAALIDSSLALMVNQDQKLKLELTRIKNLFRESQQEWQRGDVARAAEIRQLKVQLAASQGRVRELESTHDREIAASRDALKASGERQRYFEEKFNKLKYQISFLEEFKQKTQNLSIGQKRRILEETPQTKLWLSKGYSLLSIYYKEVDFDNDSIWIYPSSISKK